VIGGRHRLSASFVVVALLALTLLGLASGPGAPLASAATKGLRLDLRITDMTPRVVTANSPPALTVAGELTNTGDEPVTEVAIRTQRGDRLRTEGDLRTALGGTAATDTVTPAFTPLADILAPGQRLPIRLTVPLRGPEASTLALQRTGIYQILISTNGAPIDGQRVRLASIQVLLPVLGLPAGPGEPTLPGELGPPVPARSKAAEKSPTMSLISGRPPSSNPVTVLYPLADRPHRLPTGPGEPVLLSDDELAGELSYGGRLDGLLGALETAAPRGSALRDAICLAVDPDLLRTVRDISGGYRVRDSRGQERDGQGAKAAAVWLARLRVAAAGHCVLALPYADADLVALSRAGLNDLVGYAVRDGARIAGEILGTPVRADTTWPADGLLDEHSLIDLLGVGERNVVLSMDGVEQSGRTNRDAIGGTVRIAAPRTDRTAAPPIGILADPLLTLAASGTSSVSVSGGLDQVTRSTGGRGLGSLTTNTSTNPAGTGSALSGQDLIGAVVFRALDPASAGSPLVVAPPHRWNTSASDARELLSTISALISTGQFLSAPMAGGPGSGTDTTRISARLVYSLRAGGREVPASATAALRAARDGAAELRSAAAAEPGVGATPAQVFDPITEGLLRAASTVWRGHPDQSAAAVKTITDRVRLLRSLVRVLEPPSPYALGDREAPLPVTLANGLPVAMNVRVALSNTPGMRTAPIPTQHIPPLGRLQLRVNSQLTKSGQFSVEARLTTLTGGPLGPPSRLQLRSTAYGTITLWLTGTAGVLLVTLAVRRIVRRVRVGRPESATLAPLDEPATIPKWDCGYDPTLWASRPGTLTGPRPPTQSSGLARLVGPSRPVTSTQPGLAPMPNPAPRDCPPQLPADPGR